MAVLKNTKYFFFDILLCLSFYLLLHIPRAQATRVQYCDKKGNYAVKVHGVEISPNPVVSGQPATFNISASTGKAIPSGKVVIEVAYFGIRVHSETHDLSEEIPCPVAPGNFVLSHSQKLPEITPPGSYRLKMIVEDQQHQQLTCISFTFQIAVRSLVSAS